MASKLIIILLVAGIMYARHKVQNYHYKPRFVPATLAPYFEHRFNFNAPIIIQ